ncbi:MAG: hypothetical protein ABW252_02300 [Polyangiales bacterium]
MRTLLGTWLTCAFLSVFTADVRGAGAGEDDIDVIVHPSAPASRLSSAELEAIFTRTQTRWSDGTAVVPLSFPADSTVRALFDRAVLRLDADQVARFWLDRRIRGLGAPPKQVLSPTLMLNVVRNLRGSIGYLPSQRGRTGVKVVARIVQGKVSPQ